MELTLEQALQKGVEAHKAGKVQEADRYYTAILKANPKHSHANHNMGVLAVGVSKVEEALPFFKKALEANPGITQFWVSYIDSLIKLERWEDAKAVFAEAKNKGTTESGFDQIEERLAEKIGPAVRSKKLGRGQNKILNKLKLDQALKLAKKMTEDGLNGEAKKIYQDILKKFPKNKKAKDGMKTVSFGSKPNISEGKDPPKNEILFLIDLHKQARYQDTLNKASQLLTKYPLSIILYNIAGAAYKGLVKLDEAIEAYRKAIAIKPDYADAYNNMGNALKDQGKLKKAIEAYKKAISIKPDYADAYNNMGNALKDQSKLGEAVLAYSKALSIRPDYAEAYYNTGNAYQDQGKLDKAVVAYSKALAIRPDYTDAYNNMGNVLKDQGKLEQAKEAYRKVISINPDYAEAFNNMGTIFQIQGNLVQAKEAYHKALSIKPGYLSARHVLSSLTGDTPETAPREYVENLFDGYAKKFEVSLVENLEYQLPKLVTDILLQSNHNNSLGSVLDLGCGTGLLGLEIKNSCKNLEGIDISQKMLDIAKQKKVYNKLSHTDIVEYLSNVGLNFDYFIALDVFIYVGNLSEIFQLIKLNNKKSSRLVFSTEHTEQAGYHLLKTGRYSHSKKYIESLCDQYGYEINHFSTTNLRKEKETFLMGGIYILEIKLNNPPVIN